MEEIKVEELKWSLTPNIPHAININLFQHCHIGFPVERKYKLDTAFRAVYGNGEGPHVAVISEYDALPDIGHACGHNLIAEVGVGAGIGIKAALQEAEKHGQKLGKVGLFLS